MDTFADFIRSDDIRLEAAALAIARDVEYHDLDIDSLLHQIDGWAKTLQLRLQPDDTRRTELQRINDFLFWEMGLSGNTHDYYDPRNSFLNDVIRRGVGIPITLSILYMAVAHRLDIPAYGIGLPGHFIIGCPNDDSTLYLDPFNEGLILTREECEEIASYYLPEGMSFTDVFLSPQSPKMILLRMLNNLRQIYVTRNDLEKLLAVLILQYELEPHDAELHRDLGILHAHFEQWGLAVRHLRYYRYHRHDADDMSTMLKLLHEAIGKVCELN